MERGDLCGLRVDQENTDSGDLGDLERLDDEVLEQRCAESAIDGDLAAAIASINGWIAEIAKVEA